ncbi:hypothetical protein BEL04_17175 [Mucilaginibacter sp. PPCGB 2223]|uniref:DUF5606 family protein n=1 Tax=Mucilaginibacter sp. PPCGB 2223 TaxID=1886027 RepID=UPI0008245F1F|nr:DUF5606 domain-containing protein [Mucilaginibacter sp. PPCGB 2223]OCX51744.1 hypothetical protein BEL04_17175 [Mucilaginibacter sp. PPCGB 2223]
MNLQGIVSVSGKPGLWKALAQNKTGFILESLDAQKTKLVANLSTAKLAALEEITIFSYDQDILLKDVLERMKSATNIPDAKADGSKLRQFFREVAPDHDEEKVYASDMKKIITWFNILKELPLFNEEPATPEAETAAETPAQPAPKPKAEKAKPAAEKAKPVSKGKAKPTVVAKRGA